ncbi:four-helix bundle copper-binding protein [Rudanella paleaurantiibacter]|uniref:Four-helix bundle copper-binding protein n=1 Tax=Rudanella paleaurantiibacter TaxID=2614655 RepID=A0A7J5U3P4_9BACT|nr:four-helix bundle copper-binding protein [Rudanella paleaurantiibacter]KAB7732464.1 four-helix bundle copper-binding protein [Rudanella paleaurantiibacter]
MNWKKNIYDSLTGCAALCDETATNASRQADIENWYRYIFLNLDCADLCRQVAMLYVRGSENTRLLAKTCIEVCEKCAEEAANFNTPETQQVYAMCQQTIRSCVNILDMSHQQTLDSTNPSTTPSSLFYGIDLRETLYN